MNSGCKRTALAAALVSTVALAGCHHHHAAAAYSIGGTVTGLAAGGQVVLLDNGGDSLTIQTAGAFTFATRINAGGTYSVTVGAQPAGQTCTVTSGSGSDLRASVTTVAVACVTNTYTVGGTVSGLTGGTSLVLLDNGADALTVSASGAFTFATPVAYKGAYAVSVGTQPAGQSCSVSNGSGSGITANVTGVAVTCAALRAFTTTFAGSTTAGAADGTGTAASFSFPSAIAIDSSGNLYVADAGNNEIRKITPSGVVTTLAGSSTMGSADGTGSAASFNIPQALALDSSGNLYVADSGNNEIRMVTPAGVVTTIAGSTKAGAANGTGTAASFNYPLGIAVDSSGDVFVGDSGNNEIRKIAPGGVVTTLAGSFNTAGSADGTGAAASFNRPAGMTIDPSGNLYVVELGNNEVRKVTPGGVVTTLAGSVNPGALDGTGSAASFYNPLGIAIDANGNLYVADTANNEIRKVTAAGVVTTLAGSTKAGSTDGAGSGASFNTPQGVIVDASGNLYIADTLNQEIRKIVP